MSGTQLLTRLRALDIRLWAQAGELHYDSPRGALTPALRSELLTHKQEILAILEHLRDARHAGPGSIPRADRQGRVPLSLAQQSLWLLDRLDGSSAAYNVTFAANLSGPLTVPALAACVGDLFERHEALRTAVGEQDGEAFQIIAAPPPIPLPIVDVSSIAGAGLDREVERLSREVATRPFDLGRPPLVRAALVALGNDRHRLLVTLHHIVCDAWSLGVLMSELWTLYSARRRGDRAPLPAVAAQPADFACWQRDRITEAELQRQIAFWRARLDGLPPLLELPTDRPRPAVQRSRGGCVFFDYPAPLLQAIKDLAAAEATSVFAVLLAAFQLLLARYCNRDDVAVGSPIASRPHPDLDGTIGFFVNNLVLRTRIAPGESFRDLVQRVFRETSDAYDSQDVPFERLVEALDRGGDLSCAPIVQVRFILLNTPRLTCALPDVDIEPLPQETGLTKFDLLLTISPTPTELAGGFQYRSDLFDRRTIERMADHYRVLLEEATAHADRQVRHLQLLTPDERSALTGAAIVDPRADTGGLGAHELFERHAARTPGQIAIADPAGRYTYRQIDQEAARLAARLATHGVAPEERVALLAGRSAEMVVAILGVWKAGACYLPLDASVPDARLDQILADAGVRVVLAEPAQIGRIDSRYVVVALQPPADRAAGHDALAPIAVSPDQLAYVIYTSGSTGQPKGVGVSHRSLVNYVQAIDRRLALSADAECAALSTPAADLGHTALFGALCTGRTYRALPEALALDADALADALERDPTDCLKIVPAHLSALLSARRPERLLPRECLVLGGERLDPSLVHRIRALGPACRVVNHYGPTETTVGALTFEVPGAGTLVSVRSTPIGGPIENTVARVLDPALQLTPTGVTGELFLGGINLARGYLGRPRQTAERFIPDPYAAAPGARLYRTGDLVRRVDAGDGRTAIEFIGRIDGQCKVRGFRIELGEIEQTLLRCPGVAAAAAVVDTDDRGEPRLVAYVAARDGRSAVAAEVTAFLRDRLPPYMVPSAVVPLASLPLTANGKIDRDRLPKPEPPATAAAPTAPRTDTEARVLEIWRQVLAVDTIGVDDNFFDRGGHSLTATMVIARILRSFGVKLPVKALFEQPTVSQLAAALDRHADAATPLDGGVTIPRASREEPLPLSSAQQRLWFLHRLDGPSDAFNVPAAFRLRGALDVDALRWSLREIVQRHEVLRTNVAEYNGEAVQSIRRDWSLDVSLDPLDVSAADADEAAAIARAAVEEARRPFDLERDLLLRARVLRVRGDAHVLLLTAHHIAFDGWSIALFADELAALYDARTTGRTPNLPVLPVQYADYAAWERRAVDSPEYARQLQYWVERLAGLPPLLALPADRTRPALPTYRGGTIRFDLPHAVARKLHALAAAEGASLFMVLAAIYQILLSKLSGRADIPIGFPSGRRPRKELESSIGFFINTLVLRTHVNPRASVRALLAPIRQHTLDAFANQDVPFERVVAALPHERTRAYAPLAQHRLMLRNFRGATAPLAGLTLQPIDVDAGTCRYDLLLALTEVDAGLDGYVQYGSDVFDRATAARFIEYFRTLAAAAADDPDRPIARLPLAPVSTHDTARARATAVGRSRPRDECVHQSIERLAASESGAPAIVDDERTISYAELNAGANRLARRLALDGVARGDIVGLCMPRSAEMVTALVAVLKLGAAFLPLDPAEPSRRRATTIADAGTALVLSESMADDDLAASGVRLRSLAALLDEASSFPEGDVRRAVTGDDLAYVIYTSGSTGGPKGVAIAHRSLCNYVAGVIARLTLPADAQLMALSTIAADLAHTALFGALGSGRTLRIPPAHAAEDPEILRRSLERRPIDVLKIVPHHLAALLGSSCGAAVLPTRCLILGGAPIPVALIREIRALRPHLRIVNHYGPTETTVGVTVHDVPNPLDADAVGVPIGRPLANTDAYVVVDGEAVPPHVVGELMIGGAGVARGYWRRPALTAQRFVPNPFAIVPGDRLYRTGDLVRQLSDGSLLFAGRIDEQVKVRGFRIEPAEIEARLRAHAAVREAVVVARDEPGGDQRLVAYVVPEVQAAAPLLEALRLARAGALPMNRHQLPNGLLVSHQQSNETEYLYREIFEQQTYLRHGISLGPDACVVDVGANIGLFTLFVLDRAPRATVYAFEPIPPVFDNLRVNARLSGGNVRVFDCGLARAPGRAAFTWFRHNSLLSGRYPDLQADTDTLKAFIRHEYPDQPLSDEALTQLIAERLATETVTCPLRTLSEVIETEGIERIDLLKIDAQRGELEILDGLEAHDWARIDQLVVEVHDLDGRLATIERTLAARGFDVAVEQEAQLQSTEHYMLYARRAHARSADTDAAPTAEAAARYWSAPPLWSALRTHLESALPDYMVPAAFVALDALPLNANGKVDVRALPDPVVAPRDRARGPRTRTEEQLARIWCEVLKQPAIDVDEDFYETGGDSLTAMLAVNRARQAFGVDIQLGALYERRTVAALGEYIDACLVESRACVAADGDAYIGGEL